jgi:hypothetical protein
MVSIPCQAQAAICFTKTENDHYSALVIVNGQRQGDISHKRKLLVGCGTRVGQAEQQTFITVSTSHGGYHTD